VTYASFYDRVRTRAWELEKIFNPGALNPRSLWNPDKHPRHPSGEPDGGEFATSGGGDPSIIPVAGPKPPWHNNPPERIGDPPEVPKVEPKTDAEKFLAIRKVAYWIGWAVRFGLRNAPQTKALIAAAEGAGWMWPYISAGLQGPKTLEQLQADARSPEKGYEIHHIVEQTPGRKDGFSEAQIESPRTR
jgi:hypothetical protein